MAVGQITTFDNAYFDEDYFDLEYDTIQLSSMRTDVQSIILENGIPATLTRQTETINTMGDVTAISEASYTIFILIQDITKKDRKIHEMGLAISGNSKAFCFHEYPATITGSTAVKVQTGDIIYDTEFYWRVEQVIAEKKAEAKEIFRTIIIKKIDLSQ